MSVQTGQDTIEIQKAEWKGFEKYNFKFQNKDAWLVIPPKALIGKPWMWRARFPNFHSEADSILVSEGFHIAYVNTGGMFVNP
jgi:sialidase-1